MKVIIPGILASGLFALLLYFAVQGRFYGAAPDLQKEIHKTSDNMGSSLEKDAAQDNEEGLFDLAFCFEDLVPLPDKARFLVRMKTYNVFIRLNSPPPDAGLMA